MPEKTLKRRLQAFFRHFLARSQEPLSTLVLMEFLLDVLFASVASAFFALAIGYVLLCDRLMK